MPEFDHRLFSLQSPNESIPQGLHCIVEGLMPARELPVVTPLGPFGRLGPFPGFGPSRLHANRLDLTLHFRIFSEKEIKVRNNKSLFVLTYFGDTRALSEITTILGEEKANIETISNLTRHCASCVELTINANGVQSLGRLKERVIAKSHELNIDLALQNMEAYRKNKRLIFFDMDSTLVDMEIIDEMARSTPLVVASCRLRACIAAVWRSCKRAASACRRIRMVR